MDSESTVKLITFNCKNIKRSVDNVRDLCRTCDIIALQETWLYREEIPFLNSISPDFSCTGVSAMDASRGMRQGRPYGGVALLWRHNVFSDVTVIECNSPRICAIKIVLNMKSLLVMCVYMPTDEPGNQTDCTDLLSSVSAIIDSCNIDCVYMLGDYNAQPFKPFYYEMMNFCTDNNWSCIDIERLGITSGTYTFVSDVHGSRSWLDHCLVTKASVNTVKNVYVVYDVFWSDHFPLAIECNLNIILPTKLPSQVCQNKTVWGERTPEQVNIYTNECNKRLRDIDFPHEFRSCCEKVCQNSSHRGVIDRFYQNIVDALTESSRVGSRSVKTKYKVIVGWNKHVAEAHRRARQKFLWWNWYGRPTSGPIYREMCESRKIFKSRLKWCQNHKDQIKMNILASHHAKNDFRSFWKQTNKLQSKPSLPVGVCGVREPDRIANLFVDHFGIKSPLGPSHSLPHVGPEVAREIIFTTKDIDSVVKSMTRGKSPGHDGLSIEHLKFAGTHMPRVLYMLFNFCVGHSYMPVDMMRTVVVPIIKNKTGDRSDISNYRPISLATVISKVLDGVLNIQLNRYIKLHDNQFGFRPGLSTESAILSVKNTIKYYVERKTPIFSCFLDLSRAFDLVSYDILWRKLKVIGLPGELVSIFQYWYGSQVNNVRWDGILSRPYGLQCGVRQGGLTSPTLFNLYMNELIDELSGIRVGCYIDGVSVNNISYADDMVLLSASVCGLRRLITICEAYAESHGLVYNVKKSQTMVFEVGSRQLNNLPPVLLNKCELERVYSFKYLGHILTPDLKDERDIERERRALSVRANMLARRFARCSSEVKITLFQAFCTSFYTCSLWANYTQKSYHALRVQYNNAFRVLLGLSRSCSASGMFAEARVDCFYATMRKRCVSLVRRVRGSTNGILTMIASRLDCGYINRCCALSSGTV
jgi:exonuclease III